MNEEPTYASNRTGIPHPKVAEAGRDRNPGETVISGSPPVLKIIQRVLIRYENSLLYLILQSFTRTEFCRVLIDIVPF
jgi:hypothetical protein